MHSRRKDPFANIYWFPLAAAYAALILPWSIAGQFHWIPAPPGLSTAWGHGHEMLFGFALAVVAGYILGPVPRKKTAAIIALWVLARTGFLAWPGSWLAGLFNVAFVLALAWRVVPVFLKRAKKWRNKSVPLIVTGLGLTVVAVHLAIVFGQVGVTTRTIYLEAIILFTALMFFMGGRILAPAIGGHLKSWKIKLKNRVQPRVEGAVLLLLAASLIANALPFFWAPVLTALLLFGCAALTLVRMWRWRIWYCRDRADLLALLLGYGWLVAGWTLLAWSLLSGRWPLTLVLHAITVGALGTLTMTVMARTRMHRCLGRPDAVPAFYLLALLLTAAAVLRLAMPHLPLSATALLAAGCWSAAYTGLLVFLLVLAGRERRAGYMKSLSS